MGTPPFPPLEPETVRHVAERILGPLSAVRPLTKAFGHQSFLLEAAGSAYMIKVAREGPELARLATTAAAVRAARGGGVPVPNVLHTERSDAFEGRPFLIQEFWPGADGEDAWAGLRGSARDQFMVDFGRTTALLHTVAAAEFTEGVVPPEEAANWHTHVTVRMEKLRRYNTRAGAVPPGLLDGAFERLKFLLERSAHVVEPRLTHRDLFLRNTLAFEMRFRALLDLEHARYTDPVMEFVKLRRLVFDIHRGTGETFMQGYRELFPQPYPFETERYALCEGLELLGEIPYLQRNRRSAELAQSLERLRNWLKSSPDEL